MSYPIPTKASEHCPQLAGDKQSSLMTLEVRVEDYFNLIILPEILHYGIWQWQKSSSIYLTDKNTKSRE